MLVDLDVKFFASAFIGWVSAWRGKFISRKRWASQKLAHHASHLPTLPIYFPNFSMGEFQEAKNKIKPMFAVLSFLPSSHLLPLHSFYQLPNPTLNGI